MTANRETQIKHGIKYALFLALTEAMHDEFTEYGHVFRFSQKKHAKAMVADAKKLLRTVEPLSSDEMHRESVAAFRKLSDTMMENIYDGYAESLKEYKESIDEDGDPILTKEEE